MAEQLFISASNKEDIYKELYPQIKSVLEEEDDMIANMANLSSILKEAFEFLWVGFYIIKDKELVLGPFQGPLACTRIKYGKGVCGTAWQNKQTLIIPDVNAFQGHIACSSLSKSEIVIPVYIHNHIYGVLDIDSEKLQSFDEIDQRWLEKIVELLQ